MSNAGGPVSIVFESQLEAARRSYDAFVAETTKPLTIPFTFGNTGAGGPPSPTGGPPGSLSPQFNGIAAARGITVLSDLFAKARAEMERPIRISIDSSQAEAQIQQLAASIQGLRGGNQPPPSSGGLGVAGGGGPFWPFIPPSPGGAAATSAAPTPSPPRFLLPTPVYTARTSLTGVELLSQIPRDQREGMNASDILFNAGRGERVRLANEIAQHIPAGSKFLGQGAEALAYQAPSGDVYRAAINPDYSSIQDRPSHPLVLQNKGQVRTPEGFMVEQLPFVDTNLTGIEQIQLYKKAREAGIQFDDNGGNIGRDPKTGRTYITDPGGLTIGEPSKFTSADYRAYGEAYGAFLPPSHQEIQAEQAGLRQYARHIPSGPNNGYGLNFEPEQSTGAVRRGGDAFSEAEKGVSDFAKKVGPSSEFQKAGEIISVFAKRVADGGTGSSSLPPQSVDARGGGGGGRPPTGNDAGSEGGEFPNDIPGVSDLRRAQARAANRAGRNLDAFGNEPEEPSKFRIPRNFLFYAGVGLAYKAVESVADQVYYNQTEDRQQRSGTSNIVTQVQNLRGLFGTTGLIGKFSGTESRLDEAEANANLLVDRQKSELDTVHLINQIKDTTSASVREASTIGGNIGVERSVQRLRDSLANTRDKFLTERDAQLDLINAYGNPNSPIHDEQKYLTERAKFARTAPIQNAAFVAEQRLTAAEIQDTLRIAGLRADTQSFSLGAGNESLRLALGATDPRAGGLLAKQNEIRRSAELSAFAIFNDPSITDDRKQGLVNQTLVGGILQEQSFARNFVRNFKTEELDSINQQAVNGSGTTDPDQVLAKSGEDIAELTSLIGQNLPAILQFLQNLKSQ